MRVINQLSALFEDSCQDRTSLIKHETTHFAGSIILSLQPLKTFIKAPGEDHPY